MFDESSVKSALIWYNYNIKTFLLYSATTVKPYIEILATLALGGSHEQMGYGR